MSLSTRFHSLLTTPVDPGLLHHPSPTAGAGLDVTWLGAAGVAFDYEGHRLLLDPFITRPGLRRTFTRRLTSDEAAIRRHLPRADHILCTHTHVDHLLDVPAVARLTGARVIGSASCCNYCRAYGLPESQLTEVRAPARLQAGPLSLTLRPSRHVLTPFVGRPPLVGAMGRRLSPPLRFSQFVSDEPVGVLVQTPPPASVSAYHLGSGGFLPATLRGLHSDLLLVALMGRQQTPGFTARLLANLRPRVVIPIHFDDFSTPLERGLRSLPRARLDHFLEEVRGADQACEAVVLDLLGTYRVTPSQ